MKFTPIVPVSLTEGIEIAAHSTRNLWACSGGLEGFLF